jgi:hypothetical protein
LSGWAGSIRPKALCGSAGGTNPSFWIRLPDGGRPIFKAYKIKRTEFALSPTINALSCAK